MIPQRIKVKKQGYDNSSHSLKENVCVIFFDWILSKQLNVYYYQQSFGLVYNNAILFFICSGVRR
ncbi:hypothetical protein CTM83_18930 [Photobacterium leiognathi subsp. mandapamensis]|nr:hypothetical protein CTM83_18930 [Photobacterium leiognathi subsp. mandapamensis]